MCDTLLKVGMEIPLDSPLDAALGLGREYVVRLTHHLPDDLGGRGSASNRPYPFAGWIAIDSQSPLVSGVGGSRVNGVGRGMTSDDALARLRWPSSLAGSRGATGMASPFAYSDSGYLPS
jgi:hypothetical protein